MRVDAVGDLELRPVPGDLDRHALDLRRPRRGRWGSRCGSPRRPGRPTMATLSRRTCSPSPPMSSTRGVSIDHSSLMGCPLRCRTLRSRYIAFVEFTLYRVCRVAQAPAREPDPRGRELGCETGAVSRFALATWSDPSYVDPEPPVIAAELRSPRPRGGGRRLARPARRLGVVRPGRDPLDLGLLRPARRVPRVGRPGRRRVANHQLSQRDSLELPQGLPARAGRGGHPGAAQPRPRRRGGATPSRGCWPPAGTRSSSSPPSTAEPAGAQGAGRVGRGGRAPVAGWSRPATRSCSRMPRAWRQGRCRCSSSAASCPMPSARSPSPGTTACRRCTAARRSPRADRRPSWTWPGRAMALAPDALVYARVDLIDVDGQPDPDGARADRARPVPADGARLRRAVRRRRGGQLSLPAAGRQGRPEQLGQPRSRNDHEMRTLPRRS